MGTPGTGLQTSRFKQTFSTIPGSNEVYTTESYVNQTVLEYLNTNSSVNINIGNGVSILNTVTGSTYTTVNVGLSASLRDVEDVNLPVSLSYGDYLMWTGSSWQTGTGVCVNDLSVRNLNEFYGNINENSVIFSPNGISFYFREDRSIGIDYLTTPAVNGLQLVKDLSSWPYKASLRTNFSSFGEEAVSDATDNSFVLVKPDGNTIRIKKEDIDVSEFLNFSNSVINVISGTSGLSVTNINDSTFSSGLSLTGTTINLNLSNYLTGSSGTLPISRGGTSAINPADARSNLGLSYNSYGTCYHYDIMGYSRPEFREGMLGDNIRLVPGISSISVLSSGSGYNPASSYYVTHEGFSFSVNVTTGPGGSGVSQVTFTDPVGGFPYIYENFNSIVAGVGASGAEIGVCVTPVYINFGQYSGASGYGIRDNHGEIQVKKKGDNWKEINKSIGVSELIGVSISASLTGGDFLIYSGTCFRNLSITGAINIDAHGVATMPTGSIHVSSIDFGTPGPSVTDFQNLTGTTGNIQGQLDEKLYTVYPNTSSDSRILLLNGDVLTGTSASVLIYDTGLTGDAKFCNQFPMMNSAHTTAVSSRNLYDGFTSSNLTNTDPTICASVCLLEDSRNVATNLPLTTFFDFSVDSSGGIDIGGNNKYVLNIDNLEEDSGGWLYEDYLAIGPSLGVHVSSKGHHKTSIKDIIKINTYSSTGSLPTSGDDSYFTGATAVVTDGGTNYFAVAVGVGGSWRAISFNTVFP